MFFCLSNIGQGGLPMKIKFKFNLKCSENSTSNNQNQDIHNKKYIVIIITTIIICIILFCSKTYYFNIVVIGNDSDDNTIKIRNSETTAVTLSTDETTVISDS